MSADMGQAVYAVSCVLAVICALGLILANVFYVGGGLIPDIGAVMVGGVIWLAGRTVNGLLGANRRNLN
jgi:hypothetical protein